MDVQTKNQKPRIDVGAEFEITVQNENDSKEMLAQIRPKEGNLIEPFPGVSYYDYDGNQVLYLSDLHLDQIVAESQCETIEDINTVINQIGQALERSYKEYVSYIKKNIIVLINGDIAHSSLLFEMFTKMEYRFLRNALIILGNHELWAYPKLSVEEIVEKYRKLSPVPVIHNEIVLFMDEVPDKEKTTHDVSYLIKRLSFDKVMRISQKELSKRMLSARVIMLAGIGFSGCNNVFNANSGIYGSTLSREEEITESKKFEALYDKFVVSSRAVKDRVLIVSTHMPIDNWKEPPTYEDGIIYISGHTHRNFFYDDGMQRIYADNQNGYYGRHPSFKCIYTDDVYDPFISYTDGIYEISKTDYLRFYQAKKMSMQLKREIQTLYMLKKKGFYCFIEQMPNGFLRILNGGRGSNLYENDVRYYYERMDKVIEQITGPLERYTAIQKHIAEAVKSFGGTGNIHGCIVDIDYFNHIYVNPFDLTIRGYYALDIIHKWVYYSISSLLEDHSPELFKKYKRLLKTESENALAPLAINQGLVDNHGIEYLDTDIYRASREIRKMQKLYNNVLNVWSNEEIPNTGLPGTKNRLSEAVVENDK